MHSAWFTPISQRAAWPCQNSFFFLPMQPQYYSHCHKSTVTNTPQWPAGARQPESNSEQLNREQSTERATLNSHPLTADWFWFVFTVTIARAVLSSSLCSSTSFFFSADCKRRHQKVFQRGSCHVCSQF